MGGCAERTADRAAGTRTLRASDPSRPRACSAETIVRNPSFAVALAMAAVAFAGALSGCARPAVKSGDVLISAVEPPDAERHVVGPREDFVVGRPLAVKRAHPDYPEELLAHDLPIAAICVEVTVDEAGQVEHTSVLSLAPRCPDLPAPVQAALKSAVDEAVSTWVYGPSYACVLREDAQADGTCAGAHADPVPVPILHAYRFVFRQTADGPVVTAQEQR